jgi:hypothetical protein
MKEAPRRLTSRLKDSCGDPGASKELGCSWVEKGMVGMVNIE